MKRWLIIILAIAGLVGITGLTLMMREFDAEEAVRVNIPKGATNESVRDSLTSSLGSGYGGLVYRLWRMASGSTEKAHGSYLIEPGTKVVETVHRLGKGRQTPVNLTINNVRTFNDLKKEYPQSSKYLRKNSTRRSRPYCQNTRSLVIPYRPIRLPCYPIRTNSIGQTRPSM